MTRLTVDTAELDSATHVLRTLAAPLEDFHDADASACGSRAVADAVRSASGWLIGAMTHTSLGLATSADTLGMVSSALVTLDMDMAVQARQER